MKRLAIYFCIALLPFLNFAQCAMCRTQVVNNVSEGDTTFAQALNYGILYLFVTPYIALGVIAFFWYRSSKKNERKIRLGQRY